MTFSEFWLTHSNSKNLRLVGPLFNKLAAEKLIPQVPTIYVDGGAHFRIDGPSISVGDNDSYHGELDVRLSPKKDESDLKFALRQIPNSINEIDMHGFLGGRKDQELAVWGEIDWLLRSNPGVRRVNLESRILAFNTGHHELKLESHFSIFVMREGQIQMTGDCEFLVPTPTPILPLSSFGMSNRGFGRIQIECDQPFFIFTISLHEL